MFVIKPYDIGGEVNLRALWQNGRNFFQLYLVRFRPACKRQLATFDSALDALTNT